MKITDSRAKKININLLREGEMFMREDVVYMKTPALTNGYSTINCVRMKDGHHMSLEDKILVTPVDAELIITGKTS